MIKSVSPTVAGVRRRVNDYVNRVLSGKSVVGKMEKLAVERYVRDQETCAERGLRFDEKAATRAVNFFPLLKLTTGEYYGKPFDLADFQVFIVWNLCGWMRGDVRRFRNAFVSLARGNGKSPFAAGLILYLWGFDSPKEPRAECYTVATKRDQARIVFDEAKRMVEAIPALQPRVKNYIMGLALDDGSSLKPIGSDSKNVDGLVIHGIVLDELHEWQSHHRGLYEKIETAMGKRRQPMLLAITTAGSDESELWEEQYSYARHVLEGATDADSSFVFSCEIDDDDDPLDESVWCKANPLLASGVVKIQHLRDMAAKAATRPDMREEFRRYHCNRRAWSTAKFITPEMWEMGNKPLPDLAGAECYGGFDWGWADDLAGFGWVFLIGQEEVEDTWRPVYAMVIDAFIAKGSKRELDRDPWRTWIDKGLLTVTDSEHVDPYAIYKNVEKRSKDWYIHKIGFDRFNCDPLATRVIHELGIEMEQFPQSYAAFHAPTIEFRNALEEGRLIHGGNDLAGWCAMNMVKRDSPDGMYTKPSKKRSADKIDPLVAVIMALGEAMYGRQGAYEQAGSLAL